MTEVLGFCNKFAVNAFGLYIVIRLLGTFFADRIYDRRFLYLATGIFMIATILVDYYTPYVWINLLTSVLLIFLLTCCYEAKIWGKILAALGINVLLAFSEMIIALLMKIDNLGVLSRASNSDSIAFFLSRIIFWIIVTVVQKIMRGNKADRLSRKVTALTIIVFLTLVSELLFLCIRKQESLLIESAVLFGAEVTVYLLIYLQDCLVEMFAGKEQASLIEQEKEYYQKEAVILQQKQEQQRQFRHDMKNRIQILNNIAEHGDISELKKYLSEVEAKHKEYEVFSNTGNLIIDSIINSKLGDAAEKSIRVTASVILPAAIGVNTDDMVVIFGNLLDNAIEASERVKTSKYIDLFVSYEEGCMILRIRNNFDKVKIDKAGDFVTRKEDDALHGIGIKSVKSTVAKYDGIIEFATDGTEFTVDIMIYI
jgi:signal transduction histidine kinase